MGEEKRVSDTAEVKKKNKLFQTRKKRKDAFCLLGEVSKKWGGEILARGGKETTCSKPDGGTSFIQRGKKRGSSSIRVRC